MLKRILCLLFVLLLFTAPVAAEEDFFFGQFEAENLNGEGPVTEAIFEDAALTFINFWATWCPPCVEELPALAVIDEETGGEVQVIGVLMDAIGGRGRRDDSAIAAMRKLLDNANAEFPVLFPEGDIILEIMSAIQAVPTTVVVDREGMVVDVHVGSMTLKQWLAYAQELLDGDA